MPFQRPAAPARARGVRLAAAALALAAWSGAGTDGQTARAAPLDEPFVGGMSFSGPTSGNLAAIYWNPAALGLVRGVQLMAAASGRLATTRAALAGAPGGAVTARDLSQPFQYPLGPGGFLGVSWDLGADRFTIGFAMYTPSAQKVSFPVAADRNEPTRYHVLTADLRNAALVPALSIRFAGDFRVGFAPGFLFSTGRFFFAEPLPNGAGDARVDVDSGQGLGDAKFAVTLGGGIYFRRRSLEFGLAYASRPLASDVSGVEVAGERSRAYLPTGAEVTCGLPDPNDPNVGVQKSRCVFGDIAYGLPDIWTGGVTWHPRAGWEVTGMLRWLWFHAHDRLDARLTGPTLEANGLPERVVLYRGFHDVWDARVRVSYWWREAVRVGAALRVETSAVDPSAVTPAAVDGLKIEPMGLVEVRVTQHLWLGGGYGITLMRDVSTGAATAFQPGAAAACAAAGGNLNDPSCVARLQGRARPSPEGTYGLLVHDFGATLTARF